MVLFPESGLFSRFKSISPDSTCLSKFLLFGTPGEEITDISLS